MPACRRITAAGFAPAGRTALNLATTALPLYPWSAIAGRRPAGAARVLDARRNMLVHYVHMTKDSATGAA